jgi:hypothetical protein
MLVALPAAARLPWTRMLAPVAEQPAISPLIDELNQITLAEIYPAVPDNFFTASPLLAYLRESTR